MNHHPQNLIAWMDGELPDAEADAIAKHIEGCPECALDASRFAALGEQLKIYCGTGFEAPPRARLPRTLAAIALPIAAALVLLLVTHRPPPLPERATVRIAIPADAVLPPGAAPPGLEFIADVEVNTLP
jgi:anti-sigma factor RsiW